MSTFADYVAAGSGFLAWRLVIEGCPVMFVSDSAMETELDDGRLVVSGLEAEGISLDESVSPAGAEMNVKLSSLQIVERSLYGNEELVPDIATRVFTGWTGSEMVARLLEEVSELRTDDIQVDGAAALTVGQRYHVGTEVWRIAAITPGDAVTPAEIDVERGLWDTTAQAFPYAVPTARTVATNFTPLTSAPNGYAKRRCWLYAHTETELSIDTSDHTLTGTVVWRGVVARNPETTDPHTWTVNVESRLSLFNQEIGRGIDGGTALRGIYYSALANLTLVFTLHATVAQGSAPDLADPNYYHRLVFTGFYETQAAFATALQAALIADTVLAGWRTTYGISWEVRPIIESARGNHDGWDLWQRAGTRWLDVMGGSPVDGSFTGQLYLPQLGGGVVSTVTAGQVYRCQWSNAAAFFGIDLGVPESQPRQVPRAYYYPNPANIYFDSASFAPISDATIAAYPLAKFYLDFHASIASAGVVKITPPTPPGSTTPVESADYACLTSSAEGAVYLNPGPFSGFACAGNYQAEFALTTAYGLTDTVGGLLGCTFAEFIAYVIQEAPTLGNTGAPFILEDDVADWGDVVRAVIAGTPSLARRIYSFTKPKKLIDVVREECKLHGLYLCLDSDGKITVKPLPSATSAVPVLTIDASVHTPGDDFGSVKITPDAVIAKVLLKGGYSSVDDKWHSEWTFDNLAAMAQAKSAGQTLEITPYARPTGAPTDVGDIPLEEARRRIDSVLALFGSVYYVYDIPVTMAGHVARIGDEVFVTVPQLPYGGARGATTSGGGLNLTRGFVIGRRWMYGSEPGGTLTVLVQGVNTAGYAPSARIVNASSTAGSAYDWTFTVEQFTYGTGVEHDASWFAAGYKVVVQEIDAESPQRITGTVYDVTGDTISILLDAPLASLGSVLWDINFDGSSTSAITTAQRGFVYMADPTGRVSYSDGTSDPPRIFA